MIELFNKTLYLLVLVVDEIALLITGLSF